MFDKETGKTTKKNRNKELWRRWHWRPAAGPIGVSSCDQGKCIHNENRRTEFALRRQNDAFFRLFCCCLCTLRWLVCVTNDVLIHTPNRARWHMRDDNDSDKSESGPTKKRGRAHTPWFMQMIAAAGSLYCARFEKQTDVASNRIFVPIHLSLSLTAANWFGPNFVQMPKMCTFRVVTKKSGIFQEWLSDRGQLKRHMQKNCFDKMHKLPFTSSQHISPFFVRTKPADRGSGPNGER